MPLSESCRPSLIVLSGLPGAGKSTIARQLATVIGAVWLRMDSIEQAVRASGVVPGDIEDAGYRAAYAIARDNLCIDLSVVADSVNGWKLTRDAWRDVGMAAAAFVVEVELVCSDIEEHRRRVGSRIGDVPGLTLPDWSAVVARNYQPWDRDCLRVDTARIDVSSAVAAVEARLGSEPGGAQSFSSAR